MVPKHIKSHFTHYLYKENINEKYRDVSDREKSLFFKCCYRRFWKNSNYLSLLAEQLLARKIWQYLTKLQECVFFTHSMLRMHFAYNYAHLQNDLFDTLKGLKAI